MLAGDTRVRSDQKAASNMSASPLAPRIDEYPHSRIEFDELTEIHEGQEITCRRCMVWATITIV
jgi:hypothetical protein